MSRHLYPSQTQLTIPLLESLYDLGPSAPRDVYGAVAAFPRFRKTLGTP